MGFRRVRRAGPDRNRRRLRGVVPAMDEPRAMRRERGAPAVRTAVGVGGICLAAVASWSSTLLVVRGQVVPGWGVSAVLLGLAVVLRWGLHRVGGSARTGGCGSEVGC